MRLGNFIQSEDVIRRMKKARTAFCLMLILPFIGLIIMVVAGRPLIPLNNNGW